MRQRLLSFWNFIRAGLKTSRNHWSWWTAVEILAILLWSGWIGKVFWNFSPSYVPLGGDYSLQVESYFAWKLLPRCGTCMLWNGTVNGGFPTFAELRGGVLHPLVILSTLIWGVVNGSKLLLIGSLFLAGLAQWWLARVMGLGRAPRLWAAGMAVVGGHLAGRMEDGLSTMVLSIATTSLVLAPLVELALTRRKRAVIWLGVTLALSLVSGQGYIQIALIFGILPAVAVFWLDGQFQAERRWKGYTRAGLLALLLSGIFLIPALHFWPNFTKDADIALASAQPLAYMPLNLVIADMDFFRTEALGHISAPFVYTIFIGWIPVVLAALSLWLVPRRNSNLLLFFLAAIGLLFAISSREVLTSLLEYIPQIAGIRFPSMMTGMTVPLVLGLAAWSLDLLIKKTWPTISLNWSGERTFSMSLAWLALGIPLILAVHTANIINTGWYHIETFPLPEGVLYNLKTPTSQWVSPPYGDFNWTVDMLDKGYKISELVQTWGWKDRQPPKPRLNTIKTAPGENYSNAIYTGEGLQVVPDEKAEYAFIDTGDKQVPCAANALGGQIDITCSSDTPGTLIVKENNWTGWVAWMDGQRVSLLAGDWLMVNVSPGKHTFAFRYRPLDVWLGLMITLAGLAYLVYLARQKSTPPEPIPAASAELEEPVDRENGQQ